MGQQSLTVTMVKCLVFLLLVSSISAMPADPLPLVAYSGYALPYAAAPYTYPLLYSPLDTGLVYPLAEAYVHDPLVTQRITLPLKLKPMSMMPQGMSLTTPSLKLKPISTTLKEMPRYLCSIYIANVL